MISFIGASNIDILAKSNEKIVPFDSNIGSITYSSGGVIRNVLHSYSLVKPNTSVFFTCLGKDEFSKLIYNELKDITDLSHIIKSNKYNTSTFLAVIDNNSDLNVAVNDMAILDLINKDYLEENKKILESSEYIVIDSNLKEETYDYLFNNFKTKICAEAVSSLKVKKLKPYLDKLYILKCNLLELEALTSKVNSKEDLISNLESLKVPEVYVTLGSNGAICYKDHHLYHYQEVFKDIKSTIGLGDAFFAGIIYSKKENFDIPTTLKVSTKFSLITSRVISATNQDLCLSLITEEMN